jgi:6-phosphofructokinase 1
MDYLPNPLEENPLYHPPAAFYISQSEVVLRHIILDLSADSEALSSHSPQAADNRAGQRRQIFF